MAPTIVQDYQQQLIQTILDLSQQQNWWSSPLNLGGGEGPDGGSGVPVGDIFGQLIQSKVAFDTTEAAVLNIPISGASLVTNLDRIRYRLTSIESSGAVYKGVGIWDNNVFTASGVTDLNFVNLDVTVSGMLATISGGIEIRWDDGHIASGVTILNFEGPGTINVTDDNNHKVTVTVSGVQHALGSPAHTDVSVGGVVKGESLVWDGDEWVPSGVSGVSDHGGLTGLGDDDHSQYALLAGRVGGQVLWGGTGSGEDLTITSQDDIIISAGGDVIVSGGMLLDTGSYRTAPTGDLHITKGLYGGSSGSSALIIEDDTNVGMKILSPSNTIGYIWFGDVEDNNRGRIFWDHEFTDNTTSTNLDGFFIAQATNELVQVTASGTMIATLSSSIGSEIARGALHVSKRSRNSNIVAQVAAGSDDLIIDSSDITGGGMSIVTAPLREGNIFFSNTDAIGQGRFVYDHNTDTMQFWVAGIQQLNLTDSQMDLLGGDYTIINSTGDLILDSVTDTLFPTGDIIFGTQTSTTGQLQIDNLGADSPRYTGVSSINSGSVRFRLIAAMNSVMLSLGTSTVEGGDVEQWRDGSGGQQLLLDADAANDALAQQLHGRLQVGSFGGNAPITIQGDNSLIKNEAGDIFTITSGDDVIIDPTGIFQVSGNSELYGTLWLENYLDMAEIAEPGTPPAGDFRIYPKANGRLYGKNDAGNEYDLTISGFTNVGQIDHGGLTGLGDDDHSQYALLDGRSGGQILYGGTGSGDDLTLYSTSHATNGSILIPDDGLIMGDWSSTEGQFEVTAGIQPTMWLRAGFNAGSTRVFFAPIANGVSFSLGIAGVEGGDIAQYRDTASNQQLYVDADAVESATAMSLYGHLVVGETQPITFAGDTGTISTGGADNLSITSGDNIIIDPAGIVTISGSVGINTDTPGGALHVVVADSAGTAATPADDFIVESTGSMGMTLLANAAGSSNLYLGNDGDPDEFQISHNHSSNTSYIGQTGSTILEFTATAFTFNQFGLNRDFRVETDTAQYMFFVDGGNNQILMDASNTITVADGTLHVHTANAGSVSAHANADDFIIENSTTVGMSFLVPNNTSSYIMFGDPTGGNDASYIQHYNGGTGGTLYYFSNAINLLQIDPTAVVINEDGADVNFRIESDNATDILFVDAGLDIGSGRIGVGTSLPQTLFHASGVGTFNSFLDLQERVTVTTPNANFFRLYPKTDGKLYGKNSSGTEYDLTSSPSVYEIRLQTDVSWPSMPDSNNVRYFAMPAGFAGPQLTNDAPPHVVSRAGTIKRVIAYASQQVGGTVGSNENVAMYIGINGSYTSIGNLDLSTITPGSVVASIELDQDISVSENDLINARINPPASFATNPTFIFFSLIAFVEDGG